MVIVDTSVWINHFKEKNESLATLIEDGEILVHPYVIGELACGHLKHREEILDLLHKFPSPEIPTLEEVLAFISKEKLYGRGIGWVDVNLLASAMLSDSSIWTHDNALNKICSSLKRAFEE